MTLAALLLALVAYALGRGHGRARALQPTVELDTESWRRARLADRMIARSLQGGGTSPA